MKLLIISDNYPSLQNPTYGIFVYNAVQMYSQLGTEVVVISPISIWALFNKRQKYGNETAKVYRPLYLSFSMYKLLSYNTYFISHFFSKLAVRYVFFKSKIDFEYVYCHFLWSYLYSYKSLVKTNKKIFVGIGENKRLEQMRKIYGDDYFFKALSSVTGFITVSSDLVYKLKNDYFIDDKKILLAPNGINKDVFYPMDKIKSREKLNIPLDEFIIIYVGRFEEDKGAGRLLESMKDVPVKIIFIGSGNLDLVGENILFKGAVASKLVAEYLSASDVFVLPTLHEGSCNAIVEAMGCGLPIISSDIPEVREQVNEDCSLLIDPFDLSQIKSAVLKLKGNELLIKKMRIASLENSKKYDLKNRIKNIIEFMNSLNV